MAFIDLIKKEVHCKIVYYGPGRSGKTTNLLTIYSAMDTAVRGKMLTIETKGDRTLFFDFLPLNLGKIRGFNIRIQLYTVPGQVMYAATRRLVLKGADGVVFVADPLVIRREKNIESFACLKRNLNFYNLQLEETPIILQYNKQDLLSSPTPTLTIAQMEEDLNQHLKLKSFAAVSTKGIGVFESLKEISKQTVRHVATRHLLTDHF